MAEIVLVGGSSHSPYLFGDIEMWEECRRARPISPDVPQESAEVNQAKLQRCRDAFDTLRQKVEEVKPDVLLIFGDDQQEQFDFSLFPAFGMYLGEEVTGSHPELNYAPRILLRKQPEEQIFIRAPGHPQLGKALMENLMDRGFDIAFSLDKHKKERGVGHAFMNPAFYITPELDIPILPFWVNCYYPPQPKAKRCYELGRAVREAIEALPLDLRVAVFASGGLWHTPGVPDAVLNEEFDRAIVKGLRSGNAREMAEFFDNFPWDYGTAPARGQERAWTGMSGGVGNGTGETRNWIVAAAVADGRPATWVEYVPVYASPCGMAFAYWDMNGSN